MSGGAVVAVAQASLECRGLKNYAGGMNSSPKPHRPVVRDPGVLESLGEGSDPVADLHAAHESAAALLHRGRAANDPALTERLVALVDEVGLSTLADLWAARPARSLPGALWSLYALHEWMVTDPQGVARDYAAGIAAAGSDPEQPARSEPPSPDEVRRIADEILRGAFTGDFGEALERASAFCDAVATGRADSGSTGSPSERPGGLREVARDLAACARLWRSGKLQ